MINIGIDVHKKTCVAAIKGRAAKTLEQTEFSNTADGIRGFIGQIKKKYAKHKIRAVCEATGNYWILPHDMLEDNKIDTQLAYPAKTRAIAQAKLKDDKVDSEVLANLLRMDMVYESFVPDRYYRDLRFLSRARIDAVRMGTGEKNKITAILAKYAAIPPTKGRFTVQGIQWMHELCRDCGDHDMSEMDRTMIGMGLDRIEMLQQQATGFERKIAAICRDDPRTRLMMTVPGISHVTALAIISEIVDIRRFPTAEKLAAYAGLVPSHRNSGETIRGGPITRTGSAWLRYAIVNAATVAVQHDSRMGERYDRIARRRGKQKAKVAVARTLAKVIWYMLTNETEYRTQNKELTQRKYKMMECLVNASD